MRKLKLQMQLSIDGYVASVDGGMDWMTWNWGEDIKSYVKALTEPIDTIILGRKLAEGFIPHWAGVAADKDNPEVEAGKKFTDIPKIVFTKTLDQSPWDNTDLAKGDLTQEVNKLKAQPSTDIMAYGGSAFASDLIAHNLIDEYHLFINPVVIGKGMPIFQAVKERLNLKLVKSEAFSCGIVVVCYESVIK